MSLMDTVSKLLGGDAGDSSVNAIVQMLGSHEGGSAGLVKRFQDSGLGNIMSSWLGSGENLPISPDQIKRVLSCEQISTMAAKFGISSDVASSKLAELLPAIVDKLSPNGRLPEGSNLISQATDLLKGVVSKSA